MEKRTGSTKGGSEIQSLERASMEGWLTEAGMGGGEGYVSSMWCSKYPEVMSISMTRTTTVSLKSTYKFMGEIHKLNVVSQSVWFKCLVFVPLMWCWELWKNCVVYLEFFLIKCWRWGGQGNPRRNYCWISLTKHAFMLSWKLNSSLRQMHRTQTAMKIYIICFPDGSLTGFVYTPGEHTNLARARLDGWTLWLCRAWISLPRRHTLDTLRQKQRSALCC